MLCKNVFRLHFSIMLRHWFDDQDFIVVFNFFSMLENSWKYGLQPLSISKKYIIIAFSTFGVLRKKGVDGRLLHAITAFYGANWSFAVEYMASNQSFPYRR